jgi:hypothetical protein
MMRRLPEWQPLNRFYLAGISIPAAKQEGDT